MPALRLWLARSTYRFSVETHKTAMDMATLMPIFSLRCILFASESRLDRSGVVRNMIHGNMANAMSMTPEYAILSISIDLPICCRVETYPK